VPFFVYILRCSDDSLYVGFTTNLAARLDRHQTGDGSTWTRLRRPVEMVYAEEHSTLRRAETRETQLKGWTHARQYEMKAWDWKDDPRPHIRSLFETLGLRPSLKDLDVSHPEQLIGAIASTPARPVHTAGSGKNTSWQPRRETPL